MSKRDLSKFNASEYANAELDYIIKTESKARQNTVPSVTAEEAIKAEKLFKIRSERDEVRVLFISRNTDLLNPTTQSLDGYINISDLFDEVHILILREGIPPKHPVLRVADNVWIYTASAKHWWQTPRAGMEMLENQLVFADGFRADLVVARDPFESAVVAYRIAKKYNRPTQLHIMEDYTTAEFIKADPGNTWRLFLPFFTIPKFASVRTETDKMEEVVRSKFKVKDLATLPRFQNYEALIDSDISINLKEKYKPFIFFFLYIGKLDHNSTLYKAIDAARFVLRNPRVGMIVIGDGKSKSEFVKRTKILGIEKQVVFESRVKDHRPYLKSANVLLVSDTDEASEEIVLEGAAAGIPMVMAETDKRKDLFVDGESAFLFPPDDIQTFTNRINDLLNNINLRKMFAENTQEMIRLKFHSDPEKYFISYRNSIEKAILVGVGESEGEEEVVDS